MTQHEAKIKQDLYTSIIGSNDYTLRSINVKIIKTIIDEPIINNYEVIIVGQEDNNKENFIYDVPEKLAKR